MLQFCSLYSGSSGNSFLIKSDNTTILVDSGVSARKIVSALSDLDISINDISGILVTHEHIDHVSSLDTLSYKYNIPVYTNTKTWDALGGKRDKINENNKKIFNLLETFEIGDLKIFPFNVPHDAQCPCGFNISNNDEKLSIATDLGHVTNKLLSHLENSSAILLEANYSEEMLKYSRYPYMLKQRISGSNGHLGNIITGDTICKLMRSGLKQSLLVHLSKENNFPELAHKTVEEQLIKNNYSLNDINISVAPRNEPSPLFNIGA